MENNFQLMASIMKVLGDPTRLKILELLSDGEQCACNMLEHFSITQPTLSYHMKMLTDNGLVHARKDGIWIKYSINQEKMDEIVSFFSQIRQSVGGSAQLNENCCMKKAVN